MAEIFHNQYLLIVVLWTMFGAGMYIGSTRQNWLTVFVVIFVAFFAGILTNDMRNAHKLRKLISVAERFETIKQTVIRETERRDAKSVN